MSGQISTTLNVVDRILASTHLRSLTYDEKLTFKRQGRATPDLTLIQSTGDRHRAFRREWYVSYSWLTGSSVTNRLYCWPCLIFSHNESFKWARTGFVDLRNFRRCAKKHETSAAHVRAGVDLTKLGSANRIDHLLDEGARLQTIRHNEVVRKNREMLKRLVSVTSLLARQEMAFRGHDESEQSASRGNYRETVDVVALWDDVLTDHFQAPSAGFVGCSKIIQNDLISAVATVLQHEIQEEIDSAPFFAWQIDETTDVSCHAQLAIILRFVDITGCIQERFWGFFDVSAARNAQAVFNLVDTEMDRFNYSAKLVGQTYDGAAVMASELNGLRAKVKAKAPNAVFVHCYAHRLNLVLAQGARCIYEAKVFFGTLTGFTSFFAKSSKRVMFLEDTGCPRMPRTAPTRWNFSSRLVSTVANHRDQLLDAFERMLRSDDVTDQPTIYAVRGFIQTLEDFQFMFLLLTYNDILSKTAVVFDILQQKISDVAFCKRTIGSLIEQVTDNKSEASFLAIYNKAIELTDDPGNSRRRTGAQTPQQHYRDVYMRIQDNLIEQINVRYSGLDKLAFLELLDPSTCGRTAFPEEALQSLMSSYGTLFDGERLRSELSVFYADQELHSTSGKLCDTLAFFKSSGLDVAMPELYRLMCLVATVGATSAGVERSFSCLKRVKTFARNTIAQERLRNLGLIAVEKAMVKKLERDPRWYDRVIDEFATKSRRVELIYKV